MLRRIYGHAISSAISLAGMHPAGPYSGWSAILASNPQIQTQSLSATLSPSRSIFHSTSTARTGNGDPHRGVQGFLIKTPGKKKIKTSKRKQDFMVGVVNQWDVNDCNVNVVVRVRLSALTYVLNILIKIIETCNLEIEFASKLLTWNHHIFIYIHAYTVGSGREDIKNRPKRPRPKQETGIPWRFKDFLFKTR